MHASFTGVALVFVAQSVSHPTVAQELNSNRPEQSAMCRQEGQKLSAIQNEVARAEAAKQSLPVDAVGSVRSEDIRFQPFAAFPSGAAIASVAGDPTKPGPYVVRVRVADGVKLMPHVHYEDRIYTVISGVFYIGFGSQFEPDKLQAFGPGSVIVLPRNTPHFHWARSGTYVTQVTGTGPLSIEYLSGIDDPRTALHRTPAPNRECIGGS